MSKIALVTTVVFWATTLSADELSYPPKLPNGDTVVTNSPDAFRRPTGPISSDVLLPKTAPSVDFAYYPEQNYPGNPWSVWGDSLAVNGKYYSAIGDHRAPQGNAFLFEYDPETKKFRTLVDVKKALNLPEGHYVPGKIHSRIDLGSDGWLYFATHRGSTRVTIDKYHYKGDWIIRHHPKTGKTEIIAQGPVPKHCIPTSVLDPERLIFYGGTAAGNRVDPVMFFAYDIRKRKVLHTAENGPYRYLIYSRSTGRVYYVNKDGGQLMRYDPADGKPPVPITGKIGLRAATQETLDGFVYTVSTRRDGSLWRFNTKTEEIENLGLAKVGTQDYITSIDVGPTGRYLYYTPGAHGGSQKDGTPIIQFDTKLRQKKKSSRFCIRSIKRSMDTHCWEHLVRPSTRPATNSTSPGTAIEVVWMAAGVILLTPAR
ncbi:MAG: hypothetical protein CMJ78_27200 [Planctomycetaceae bacterium]|nr:hypothetical protein [Planctomycetaceae bacterium]